MKIIRVFILGVALFITAIMLISCNLEDFNLNKLATPKDIVPVISAPLAYGTFKVSDLAPAPAPPDNSQIPIGGLSLDSVMLNKSGIIFRNSAIDSVYLVTHITNETPCDMAFKLSFVDSSGAPFGQAFSSGNIPADAKDQEIKFDLGPLDQDNLQNATSVKLIFTMLPPASGTITTYGMIKSKSVTIRISFYAPVNLWKL